MTDGQLPMTLEDIIAAMQDAGYNPPEQLYGFLKTGDNSFITRSRGARNAISKIQREEIISYLNRCGYTPPSR